MKKRNPSPFITEMMEKFQQQAEQSPTRTSSPQVSQKPQKPPVQKRPENLSSSPKIAPPPPLRIRDKTPTDIKIQKPEAQETPPLQTKPAPPKPPRVKENLQHSTKTQESSSTHIKAAPQRPPRAKDREQNKQTVQAEESRYATPPLQTKPTPPKPPRVKENLQHSTKTQESSSTHIKTAPQRPPRAKDREQNKQTVQAEESRYATPPLQTKPTPSKPPRVKENLQHSTKTQESSSTHIKAAPQRPPRAKDREQNKQTVQAKESRYATPPLQTKPTPPKPPRVKENLQYSTKTQESSSTHIKAAPQRAPRAKGREQNKQTVQAEESRYATPAPQTPPRTRDRVQNDAKIQNPEEHYPSVRPKTPSHMKVRQQSSSSSQDSEVYAVPRSRKSHHRGNRKQSDVILPQTASPKTASEQSKPSHAQKTSINTMERELLLLAYQEEIRFLCKKVYGNRLILEERIEAIKENPDMGEQLLWDVTEQPKSIPKLAGKKVLGIKSHARKQAEENLPNLYEAINGYMYTSKYTKNEDISLSSHTKQRQHQQMQKEEAITRHTQNPLNSEKKIKPLSNEEIARRVQKDPSVQYVQREVQYWCKIVYNDPLILQYRLEDMQKIPEIGEELVFQIENNSRSFAPLAGRQVLGIKSGARKAAEENLPTLCTAIKDYAETIKQLRETIVQNHHTEQQRHQPLTDLDKRLQKQQSLSQPPKLPERSTAKRHQEVAETSRQEDQPHVRPRKAETSKAMALS
ncbi:BID domain-containing T4SS effector [Bartonella grahamii]|uniref:BID domain-containing T4SS effector n=1 Tax=Bartonella grahamii TaxID=33045 RepID=UPI002E7BC228|nr:BID domain-containing T4SS effector [Bartonella grahamii]